MRSLSTAEQKFKTYLEQNNLQPFSAITETERQKEAALFNTWAGDYALPFQEMHIKARDGFPIRIRIFNADNTGPTLFFMPGNGYVVKHLFDANAIAASRIAKAWGHRVVIIEFRLMPDYSWPTPVNDVQDIIKACIQNDIIPDINPAQIILGGISAGAHVSTMLALNQNRGFAIKKLLLVAGPYDLTFRQDQFAEDEALDYICKRANIYDFKVAWGLGDQDMRHSKYSPLFAPSVAHFPETHIIVGEHDGIRGDSEAFYKKLKAARVNVTKTILPGQTHNNVLFYKMCGDENDAALICAKILAERYGDNLLCSPL